MNTTFTKQMKMQMPANDRLTHCQHVCSRWGNGVVGMKT